MARSIVDIINGIAAKLGSDTPKGRRLSSALERVEKAVSGSSGGGTFRMTIVDGAGDTYTADKTFDELTEAFDAGTPLFVTYLTSNPIGGNLEYGLHLYQTMSNSSGAIYKFEFREMPYIDSAVGLKAFSVYKTYISAEYVTTHQEGDEEEPL